MTTRAVAWIGVGQLVNWGVLYYAFAVLVRPLEQELGVATWVVTGAFSMALLMSAMLAPAVGRWGDRGHGARAIRAGGFLAAALLAAWTAVPGVLALYIVWAALGLCMAAALYEPAFVLVARAHRDPAMRLRALALVTLFGGLASTLFLPGTALLVDGLGWRRAVLTLAGLLAVSTGLTSVVVFRTLDTARPARAQEHTTPPSTPRPETSTRFRYVAGVFSAVSLASAAFVANLVPTLGERGVSASAAAMLGGVIGVMQLPGRALLMHGALAGSPSLLLATSVALQAAGLGTVALGRAWPIMACGTMVFALGAGLTTLVRPYLVQAMFAHGSGGVLNGRIAMQQQLARAAGPLAIAWLAGRASYSTVFALIAVVFVMMAAASPAVLNDAQVSKTRRETT
ncbi:MAG: MFS transporter [Vicinamibacterales bacterium]